MTKIFARTQPISHVIQSAGLVVAGNILLWNVVTGEFPDNADRFDYINASSSIVLAVLCVAAGIGCAYLALRRPDTKYTYTVVELAGLRGAADMRGGFPTWREADDWMVSKYGAAGDARSETWRPAIRKDGSDGTRTFWC